MVIFRIFIIIIIIIVIIIVPPRHLTSKTPVKLSLIALLINFFSLSFQVSVRTRLQGRSMKVWQPGKVKAVLVVVGGRWGMCMAEG